MQESLAQAGEGVAASAEAFAAEVARLREAKVPGASGRLRDLFDYLADRGPAADPASQVEISAAVFGQAEPDADDATVRVYVHRLRRRLEAHYAQEPASATRLEVPAGAYALRFADAEPQSGPVAAREAPEAPAPRRSPLPGGWLFAAILALALALSAGWLLARADRPAANDFWDPLLASDRPVLVVLGDYYIYGEIDPLVPEEGRLIRDFRVNSPADLDRMRDLEPERFAAAEDVGLNYLPFAAGYGLATVIPLLEAHGKEVSLMPASQLQPDMLTRFDVVYVGLFSGMGLLEELTFMGSRFEPGESYDELVDTQTQRRFVSGEARSLPSQAYYRDYAYAARFRAPSGVQVAVLAGSRDTGLRAIGSIARAAELPEEMAEAAAGDAPFEALFEITGQQGADLREDLLVAQVRAGGEP